MIRILIVSKYRLFGKGLESLLAEEKNLEIIGQTETVGAAVEHVKEVEPDVVILDGANGTPDDHVTQMIGPILHACPKTRVVGLNLQDNSLYVYQAQQWVAKDIKDLLTATHESFGVDTAREAVGADNALIVGDASEH